MNLSEKQPRSLYNRHHVAFEKRDYSDGIAKRYREHSGLIIPTLRTNHEFLHEMMTPPPKPERAQMIDCIDYMNESEEKEDIYWGIERAIEYFGHLAVQDTEQGFKARRIEDNYLKQLGYITWQTVEEGRLYVAA